MVKSTPTVSVTGIDVLAKSIPNLERQVKRAVGLAVLTSEQDAVDFAKKNAPWTDRTGNARAGLHATHEFGPEDNFYAELIIAHSVFYGIYLEIRFSGKYAILMPTVNYIGPVIIRKIESLLAKMGAA